MLTAIQMNTVSFWNEKVNTVLKIILEVTTLYFYNLFLGDDHGHSDGWDAGHDHGHGGHSSSHHEHHPEFHHHFDHGWTKRLKFFKESNTNTDCIFVVT